MFALGRNNIFILYMDFVVKNFKKVQRKVNYKIKEYNEKQESFGSYKERYTLEERKKQAKDVIEKYPERYPIICEVSKQLPDLDKHKYLIPGDIKSETFMFIIRKRIKLPEEQAMYFFINNKVLCCSNLMSEIYDKYKDEDGFLYIYVCAESTFG